MLSCCLNEKSFYLYLGSSSLDMFEGGNYRYKEFLICATILFLEVKLSYDPVCTSVYFLINKSMYLYWSGHQTVALSSAD